MKVSRLYASIGYGVTWRKGAKATGAALARALGSYKKASHCRFCQHSCMPGRNLKWDDMIPHILAKAPTKGRS